MKEIENFFSYLSARLYHENKLSDVTWAVYQSSLEFQQFFLDFFFKGKIKRKDVEDFRREVSDDTGSGCRVDFKIDVRDDDKPYLIEVKINDQNQHFDEYLKAYGIEEERDRLGYIVNYQLTKEGFEVKTWDDLYKQLKQKISALNEGEEKTLLSGYCEYVKSTCNLIYFERPMKLFDQDFYSLYEFQQILKKILNKIQNARFTIEPYKQHLSEGWIGQYIHVSYNDLKDIYPFIGINFSQKNKNPQICVFFDNTPGWSAQICKLFKDKGPELKNIAYNYCTEPVSWDNDKYIALSEKAFSEFNNADIACQEKILCKFLEETLEIPLKL